MGYRAKGSDSARDGRGFMEAASSVSAGAAGGSKPGTKLPGPPIGSGGTPIRPKRRDSAGGGGGGQTEVEAYGVTSGGSPGARRAGGTTAGKAGGIKSIHAGVNVNGGSGESGAGAGVAAAGAHAHATSMATAAPTGGNVGHRRCCPPRHPTGFENSLLQSNGIP